MDCGYGMPVSITITCNGPSCPSLGSLFPDLQCSSGATTTDCNNGISCPGPVNVMSNFTLFQQGATVSSTQTLNIDGQMFMGSDDGNGVVSGYGPSGNQQPGPPAGPGPAPATTPVPASSTSPSSSSTATQSIVVQTSNPANRVVPTPRLLRLMFLFVMILSSFMCQVQAYSSVHFTAGTLVIFPFMWLMLAGGANGQPDCVFGDYAGV